MIHFLRHVIFIDIHHFHMAHITPCLPYKICITIVSGFSWVLQVFQRKLKTRLRNKPLVGNKVYDHFGYVKREAAITKILK